MKKIIYLLLLLPATNFFAQSKTNSIGAELQAYPRGIIPGITYEYGLNTHNAFHFRGGINIADHKNNGMHDAEWGKGPGFTPGYRYYFASPNKGWFVGIRSDLWFMRINWKNILPNDDIVQGVSDITVLQPTAEAGYLFRLSNKFNMALATEQGVEWNIHTKGEETGHGFISLVGIRIQYVAK
ncbi:MAG: DUF3575 domain-containing protein [Panacibacter sp.]